MSTATKPRSEPRSLRYEGLRAVIYARVSRDDAKGENAGRSPDEQIEESTAWCEREGIVVVGVVRDDNRSATRHAKRRREGYDLLKAEWLPRPDIDMVVTWSDSRAQRTLDEYTELRRLFVSSDTLWAYSGQVYDMTNRSDRFRTGLDALRAEDEVEGSRDALMRAMRKNAAEGRPHGRLAYGYRLVIDPKTGAHLGRGPDPDKAEIVKELAKRWLSGESGTVIAADLTARGIAPPQPGRNSTGIGKGWSTTTIKQLLTNPTMNGKRRDGDVLRDAQWEAILDDDTFAAIAAKYADPSRRKIRQRTATRMLSGIARCGVCLGPMTFVRSGGAGKNPTPRNTYLCRDKYHVSRGQADLENHVTNHVLERMSRRDALAELADSTHDDDVAAAAAEVAALEAQKADATETFLAGGMTATLLGTIEGRINPLIDAARRRGRAPSIPSTVYDLAGAGDVAAVWDTYTTEQCREVVRSLFSIVVMPVGKGHGGRFDPEAVKIEALR